MRFNWDAIIPSVAVMDEDDAIKPISGTGFVIERGKNPGEYTLQIKKLDQPTEPETPAS